MTKVCCDHCGKQLNSKKDWYMNAELETFKESYFIDLCEECVDKLESIIKDFLRAQEQTSDERKDELEEEK